jgi:chromosome segregation ATPase
VKALFSVALLLVAVAAHAQQTNCTVIGNQINCNTYGRQQLVPWQNQLPQYQSPHQMQLQSAQAEQLRAQAELARQQAEQLRAETAALEQQRAELAAERARLDAARAEAQRAAAEVDASKPLQSRAKVIEDHEALSRSEQERAKAVDDRLTRDTAK